MALHIATADGTSTTTIADPGSGPQWSPDSSHIGYYTYADEVLALHIATADGTSTTRIADDLGRGLPRPQWSPDGSHIGYYTYADEVALHIATADGTNSAQLAVGYGFGLQLPRWSPDGSRVAYYRYADGELALHIATADGTSPTEIIGTGWWGPSQTAAFAWSPDSNRVAYTKLEPEERPEDLDLRDASSWPATHVFVEVVGIKGGNPVALQPSIYGAAAGERFCGVIALSWQRNGIRFDTEDWSNWC
ncbi:MAG: hypothetical protein F4Z64_14310 [Acidimicrobiaceae bacterium]|nr:hypothetical protein [Acidimicrobiaceae bacterium]